MWPIRRELCAEPRAGKFTSVQLSSCSWWDALWDFNNHPQQWTCQVFVGVIFFCLQSNLEHDVYSRLTTLQEGFVPKRKAGADDDLHRINELIQGNMQRCKLVMDQITEARDSMLKVLDHKERVLKLLNKNSSTKKLNKLKRKDRAWDKLTCASARTQKTSCSKTSRLSLSLPEIIHFQSWSDGKTSLSGKPFLSQHTLKI